MTATPPFVCIYKGYSSITNYPKLQYILLHQFVTVVIGLVDFQLVFSTFYCIFHFRILRPFLLEEHHLLPTSLYLFSGCNVLLYAWIPTTVSINYATLLRTHRKELPLQFLPEIPLLLLVFRALALPLSPTWCWNCIALKGNNAQSGLVNDAQRREARAKCKQWIRNDGPRGKQAIHL